MNINDNDDDEPDCNVCDPGTCPSFTDNREHEQLCEAAQVYADFIALFVLGRTNDADELFRANSRKIQAVSVFLQSQEATKLTELRAYKKNKRNMHYRGLLLYDYESFDGKWDVPVISLTDNIRIAKWFASPKTTLSHKASGEGYLLQTSLNFKKPTPGIIFHYSWANDISLLHTWGSPYGILNHVIDNKDDEYTNVRLMPHEVDQLKWNLQTQHEVIVTTKFLEKSTYDVEKANIPLGMQKELDKEFSFLWNYRETRGILASEERQLTWEAQKHLKK